MTDQLTLTPLIPDWADDPIGRRWLAYHEAHPDVYGLLARLARQWREARPGQHCGLKMLLERVRWEMAISDTSREPYKIDNRHAALYARALMEWEPDLVGLFRLRTRPSAVPRPASPTDNGSSLTGAKGGVSAIPDVFRVDQGGAIPKLRARFGRKGSVLHLVARLGVESEAVCGQVGEAVAAPHDRGLPGCGSCRLRLRELLGDG